MDLLDEFESRLKDIDDSRRTRLIMLSSKRIESLQRKMLKISAFKKALEYTCPHEDTYPTADRGLDRGLDRCLICNSKIPYRNKSENVKSKV